MHIKFLIMLLTKKNLQEYNLTSHNKPNINKIQSKVTCGEIVP
jgi:hypothetical protein